MIKKIAEKIIGKILGNVFEGSSSELKDYVVEKTSNFIEEYLKDKKYSPESDVKKFFAEEKQYFGYVMDVSLSIFDNKKNTFNMLLENNMNTQKLAERLVEEHLGNDERFSDNSHIMEHVRKCWESYLSRIYQDIVGEFEKNIIPEIKKDMGKIMTSLDDIMTAIERNKDDIKKYIDDKFLQMNSIDYDIENVNDLYELISITRKAQSENDIKTVNRALLKIYKLYGIADLLEQLKYYNSKNCYFLSSFFDYWISKVEDIIKNFKTVRESYKELKCILDERIIEGIPEAVEDFFISADIFFDYGGSEFPSYYLDGEVAWNLWSKLSMYCPEKIFQLMIDYDMLHYMITGDNYHSAYKYIEMLDVDKNYTAIKAVLRRNAVTVSSDRIYQIKFTDDDVIDFVNDYHIDEDCQIIVKNIYEKIKNSNDENSDITKMGCLKLIGNRN